MLFLSEEKGKALSVGLLNQYVGKATVGNSTPTQRRANKLPPTIECQLRFGGDVHHSEIYLQDKWSEIGILLQIIKHFA